MKQLLEKESILAFVEQFEKNKLQRFIKSDNSEQRVGSLIELVGSTFGQTVLKSRKQVAVLFYAPWCRFSQRLLPIWDSLAQELGGSQQLALAQINVDNNELQNATITRLPTVRFYPADRKDAPIDYEGEQGFSQILAFIQEQARLLMMAYIHSLV